MESIELLGIKITPGTLEEICQEIGFLAGQKRQSFIIDANVHGVNLARQLPWLAEFYHRADLVYVDGAGVVLGARLLGNHIRRARPWPTWGGRPWPIWPRRAIACISWAIPREWLHKQLRD